MKKITFLLSFLGLALFSSAQTKISFEDQGLNGAAAASGGTVSVVANPVKTGVNTSAYCLDVVNNSYAAIKFANFTIPTGSKAAYPYVTLKFKIAYKAYNGSSDLDYPLVNVFSSAASPLLDATEKLGSISNVWGTHAADSLVWKNVQFSMPTSALATIPNGKLVLQVAKPKCEYLLDDIELIPSPLFGTNILTLYNFESNAINYAYTAANIYGGTVACTAVVAADPVTSTAKALLVSPTAYNQVASFSVTLPTGALLTDYDRLYFDYYSTAVNYAQAYIAANTTVIYKDATDYPTQGAAATWVTKDYELPTTVPASNTFTLFVGYTSMNSGSYYIDNVKLNHKAAGQTTGINQNHVNPLVISCDGSTLHLNMLVDRIELFDLGGRSVLAQSNIKELNVSKLNNGIYIVKSSLAGETYITKVVK